MEGVRFEVATGEWLEAARGLLRENALPDEDLDLQRVNLWVALAEGRLIGTIGMEVFGDVALLRSLAVAPTHRKRGLAHALYERLLGTARQAGVQRMFLLTATAEGFFARLGYAPMDRSAVPEVLRCTAQFQDLCPTTAQVMSRDVAGDATYFPRDTLALRPDVPGASYWSVWLPQTMLTYFEVAPHSRFDRHTHAAEQVTLVLEGELHFELDGRSVRVQAGEVIAIPGHTPHAVSTLESRARAVDAWSPPRPEYQEGVR